LLRQNSDNFIANYSTNEVKQSRVNVQHHVSNIIIGSCMLHTLSHTSNYIDTQNLLNTIDEQDAILLWQNGVTIGVKNNPLIELLLNKSIPILALITDVKARGLKPILMPQIKLIDMAECVKLTAQYYPQLAW
jgi:sulfur relay protein TusB/DsrH